MHVFFRLGNQQILPFLAPDGLTVVIGPLSCSVKCYSWNHDTGQFHPVHFDDQVHFPDFDMRSFTWVLTRRETLRMLAKR